MGSFENYMMEYRRLLEKGEIQAAYKGLMEYIMGLRSYLNQKYPESFVCGGMYYGYMDMTYFPLIPRSFKSLNLKIAIVYIHKPGRFEAWLAGSNKQVQAKYWQMIKASGWNKYRIVPTTKGSDSIIEHTLVDNPDFGNLETLTQKIEKETLTFIKDVEDFLSH